MSISKSTKSVNLSDVIDALELLPEEWSGYVNRQSGEVLSIPHDAFAKLESDDEDESLLSEADETMVALAREIESSTHFVRLPGKFEIHEWSIMREFCDSLDNAEQRDQLLEAIHGSGAFRFFQSTLRRLDLRDAWHRYKNAAIEQIAIGWLDAHDIRWKRNVKADQADIE